MGNANRNSVAGDIVLRNYILNMDKIEVQETCLSMARLLGQKFTCKQKHCQHGCACDLQVGLDYGKIEGSNAFSNSNRRRNVFFCKKSTVKHFAADRN